MVIIRIELIEINIINGLNNSNTLIKCNSNLIIKNGISYKIDNLFIEKILNIITKFKHEYGTSKNIDEEEFFITILEDNKEITYHGKGNYPINYTELKELIGE